jgi:hypothetical protein
MSQQQPTEMEQTSSPSPPEHEKDASMGTARRRDETEQLSEASPPPSPRPVHGFKVWHAFREHEDRRTGEDSLTQEHSGSCGIALAMPFGKLFGLCDAKWLYIICVVRDRRMEPR